MNKNKKIDLRVENMDIGIRIREREREEVKRGSFRDLSNVSIRFHGIQLRTKTMYGSCTP